MKNLFLVLMVFVGVLAAAPAFAQQVTPQSATPSYSGQPGAVYFGNGYFVCPWGTKAMIFYSAGTYTYHYYPYPVNYWIPGPGVYCMPW